MISVIIPIRNEERIIRRSILKLDLYLKKNFGKYEIIAFDDYSTDLTPKILDELNLKNLRVIHSRRRVGKGKSIEYCMKAAKYKKVMFIDADLQGMSSIKKMYKLLNTCEIVIGNRYSDKSKTKRTILRFFASKIFNFLVKLILNSKFDDHQCGLKGFRKSRKLFALFNMVKDNHFFWDTELIVKAQWNNFKICEVQVEWKERKETHVKLSDAFDMLRGIFRLLLEKKRFLN